MHSHTYFNLVPQLYIDVNELENQGRFNILEPEDTNSEGFVFFLKSLCCLISCNSSTA